jgi:hypothetical protein
MQFLSKLCTTQFEFEGKSDAHHQPKEGVQAKKRMSGAISFSVFEYQYYSMLDFYWLLLLEEKSPFW